MTAAPDTTSVKARCAAALEAQSFVDETGIDRKPIGGRWRGTLRSDWDSAIHVLLELAMNRPDDPAHAVGLPGVPELMEDVMGILRRRPVWFRRPKFEARGLPRAYGDADTLRLNFLAVMVLIRRVVVYPGARANLEASAQQCWRAFAPRAFGVRRPELSRLGLACDYIEEVCEGLTRTEQHAQRRSSLLRATFDQRKRLIQELRAFVLLAGLPGRCAAVVAGAPGQRLLRAKRALYEQITGSDHPEPDVCDWPPFEYLDGANILVRHLHFLASRVLDAGNLAYDAALPMCNELFDGLVPSGAAAKRLFDTLGTVAQLKDIAGAAGLVATPRRNLTSAKAVSWQEFLHETRGPCGETTGIYCHLAVATGMAVTALDRFAALHPLDREQRVHLAASTTESVQALRTLRLPAEPGPSSSPACGLAFAPYAIYNEVVLRCWLLAEELGAHVLQHPSAKQIRQAVEYLLSCQDDNGLFQQRYRTNERDEGESTATGVCLRGLVYFARRLEWKKPLPADMFHGYSAGKQDLQRRIAYAITRGAEALVELQNDSGGFPTFAKTGREKMGILGTHEGPGVQEYLLYDAPAADIVGWSLEGLCELQSGKDVPFVQLSGSLQRDIDRAVELAVQWLRRDFHPKAGWWGRYVGGYIGGTAMALRALKLAGVPHSDPIVRQAAKLLESAKSKKENGGWDQDLQGDDPQFNSRPERVAMRGNRKQSQPELTAFALMGLLDAGRSAADPVVRSAVSCLLQLRQGGANGKGWHTDSPVHSFMRGWTYVDQLQTDLKPVEALLRWLAT